MSASNNSKKEDLFFIGWQPKMQKALAGKVRKYGLVIAIVMVALAVLMAVLQQTFGVSRYAYADVKTFEGILRAEPYPHIAVHLPNTNKCEAFMIVDELKTGWTKEQVGDYDGKYVQLKAGVIYRGDVAMLEANPSKAISLAEMPVDFPSTADTDVLGTQTLVGEIVDSKCYYGAMNPGNLKTHRACAIVCIKGGIPPVLVVRREHAAPLYFLVVGEDGQPLNKEVLPYVAEPIQVTGEVMSQCGMLMLKTSVDTFERI